MELSNFKNKRVLVMGLGLHGGGVGSAEFFLRRGSRVTITDLKSRRELRPSITKLRQFKNIAYHLGGHREADFRTADYVIQGPGVPKNSKFLKIAKRAGVPVLSDVEIFFLHCPAPIIGITGTKGKSTTTWLIGRFLQKGLRKPRRGASSLRGRRIWVGGNIRRSMLEFLPRVQKNDLVVLELSSFQLDSLKNRRMSPAIAVITNIFPDHLNRYPSMTAYAASKASIFKFQKQGGALFINGRDPLLRRLAQRAAGHVIRFDPRTVLARYRGALSKRIPDFHLPNIAAAVAVARHLGVGERDIRHILKNFRGMPDRMQLVRKIGGVEFINDTTATNPHAAAEAVIATKRRIGRKRLAVIAGGYDKGLPVRDFVQALKRSAAAIVFLPGGASRKMKSQIPARLPAGQAGPAGGPNYKLQTNSKSKIPEIVEAKTMPKAVRLAYRAAKPDGVVLLSPGAASFGLFRHEFDRGEQFMRAVRALR